MFNIGVGLKKEGVGKFEDPKCCNKYWHSYIIT